MPCVLPGRFWRGPSPRCTSTCRRRIDHPRAQAPLPCPAALGDDFCQLVPRFLTVVPGPAVWCHFCRLRCCIVAHVVRAGAWRHFCQPVSRGLAWCALSGRSEVWLPRGATVVRGCDSGPEVTIFVATGSVLLWCVEASRADIFLITGLVSSLQCRGTSS